MTPQLTGEHVAKAAGVMRELSDRMMSMWGSPITPEEAGAFRARLMISSMHLEHSLQTVEVEVTL